MALGGTRAIKHLLKGFLIGSVMVTWSLVCLYIWATVNPDLDITSVEAKLTNEGTGRGEAHRFVERTADRYLSGKVGGIKDPAQQYLYAARSYMELGTSPYGIKGDVDQADAYAELAYRCARAKDTKAWTAACYINALTRKGNRVRAKGVMEDVLRLYDAAHEANIRKDLKDAYDQGLAGRSLLRY